MFRHLSDPRVPADPGGALAGELQDIVEEAAELLDAPTVLEDAGFGLLAYCSQGVDVDPVRAATILGKSATSAVREYFLQLGIATATGPVHLPADPQRGVTARICLPARSEGRTLGYLWVLEPEAGVEAAALARADALARRAGALLGARRQAGEEYERLVAELVSGNPDAAASARARLLARGQLTEQGPVAVVVIRDPAGAARLRVASVPSERGLPQVLKQLSRQVDTLERAGVSVPRAALSELPAARLEADLAARVGLGRPALGAVLSWADLGFYRVLAHGRSVVEGLLAGTPAALLRAGADAELVRTALVYLDAAGHAARTAATLSVHRQTLYYRLEKIEQLCGLDLDDGEARTQLHLGLALGEVLAHLPP